MNIFIRAARRISAWQERRVFEALPADILKDIGWRQMPINRDGF